MFKSNLQKYYFHKNQFNLKCWIRSDPKNTKKHKFVQYEGLVKIYRSMVVQTSQCN